MEAAYNGCAWFDVKRRLPSYRRFNERMAQKWYAIENTSNTIRELRACENILAAFAPQNCLRQRSSQHPDTAQWAPQLHNLPLLYEMQLLYAQSSVNP